MGRRAVPPAAHGPEAGVREPSGAGVAGRAAGGGALTAIAWKAPKTVKGVDRRVVVNPGQARALLAAVGRQKPSGPSLVAFFGCHVLRRAAAGGGGDPAEGEPRATGRGLGELLLESSTPEAGASWTDSGRRREERQLKHRAKGETRVVPCAPELTALLHDHLETFGAGPDGRLFRGVRGGRARGEHLLPDRGAGPGGRADREEWPPRWRGRPYDLRHAAVSTWLNAGVPSTQVAEWAGHSVAVLLQIYAKCIAGQEDAARRRIA